MKKNTNYLLLILFIFLYVTAYTQEEQVVNNGTMDFGLDLKSRYVWRGSDFGRAPSMQPYLAFTKGGFEIGSWGAYTTNGTNCQEADLYMTYTIKDKFALTLTDYFFPDDGLNRNHYFEYNDTLTKHVLEGAFSYTGGESFPVSLMFAMNFYGADRDQSMYFELGYPVNCHGNSFDLFVGLTPQSGIYGNELGLVNLGITTTKDIKISETFELPVDCSFITNPQAGNIFLVFGFSL